jgi:CheY-like chemotaxis protein
MVLESHGFSVLTAENGDEGLCLLNRRHVDAALVDYSMPRMDGGAVAEEIKRRKPSLPVVMLTAYDFIGESLSNTVDLFVVKGEDPDTLAQKMRSLIELRSHSHPELQNKYVVFVDAARRYLDCTDGVCELLGHRRMDLIGMGIEDISYKPAEVPPLFARFRAQGALDGEFLLKKKDGAPLLIRYRSHAFSDGCLAACWEPI